MGDRRFRDRFGRSNPFDRSPQRDDADPGDPYSNSGQNGAGRQEQPDQPYRRDRRDTPVYPDLNDNGGYQVDQTGGELLELPAPCGKHMVYYPQALKELAEQRLRFYVFQAVCGCGTAYLIATLPAGPRFWFGGAPLAISEAYERIPWPEHRYLLFTCKAAPSLDDMVNYFATRLG